MCERRGARRIIDPCRVRGCVFLGTFDKARVSSQHPENVARNAASREAVWNLDALSYQAATVMDLLYSISSIILSFQSSHCFNFDVLIVRHRLHSSSYEGHLIFPRVIGETRTRPTQVATLFRNAENKAIQVSSRCSSLSLWETYIRGRTGRSYFVMLTSRERNGSGTPLEFYELRKSDAKTWRTDGQASASEMCVRECVRLVSVTSRAARTAWRW